MPITVRELIVRATVTSDKKGNGLLSGITGMKKKDKDALLNDCVEKVLEILEREKER